MLPRVIVHADWSTDPRKRWMATATLDGDVYRVSGPAAVEQSAALVQSAVHSASGGCAVLGLDFPIGVPRAYAQLAHVESFLDVLPELGTGSGSTILPLDPTRFRLSGHFIRFALAGPFRPIL